MRKLCVLILLFNAFLISNAWAKEEGGAKSMEGSLKKAGNAAGSGMGKVGKAVAPEVSKAENWLGGALQNGGKKLDKASK